MNDLLTDPLIGVHTPQGQQRLSLPELLAALSAGHIRGYTGLRAHQADPWHVFLVQLAASIQARDPTDRLPDDPDYWHNGLLDLADGMETAWHLLVEDVTKPAFFQHPWQSWEAEAANYGIRPKQGRVAIDAKAQTPDELDVLVTSKNHDVKMARIGESLVEGWIFALLTLQTTSGFLGQGNYGIVRMNGGFASRPIVAWTRALDPSTRFQNETALVHGLRQQTLQQHGYTNRGVVLTWLAPWDRSKHQFYPKDLEPWFIEAPRPVRLIRGETGAILALGATSQLRQIGPKTLDHGDVGDPWIPINKQDKKKGRSALTLSADGFTPQRLTDLLFQRGFDLTPLQTPAAGPGDGWFVASCLARGQGATEGFHRIELPVPAKASRVLLNKDRRETLGALAQDMLTHARDVQKALGAALVVLTEGGPESADFDRDAINNWLKQSKKEFARRWEHLFFPTLWRGAEEAHEAVRKDWQQQLVDCAQDLLNTATQRVPLPANRYWRALTRAQGIWIGSLRKLHLPLPTQRSANTPAMEETVS